LSETPERLLRAAADALREDGVVAVSARTVAARAGVNQALVFYHFGTVSELLRQAVVASVDEAVADYGDRFAAVSSLAELLALGRTLHERETERGNVAQMAQVLAGAQHDAALAEAGRYAMARWSDEVETVVRRVTATGPLSGTVEPGGLARAVVASFVGLELYEGVDPAGAAAALAVLDVLSGLLAALDELGPVASRAVRASVRRRAGGPRIGPT
jgi:AcrR family transcriptional regulator